MKRIPLYIIIIALVFIAPVESINIGTLRPIEVVSVYEKDGQVVVETDTGDLGKGQDASQALADMKQTAPAVIYLDTARYLLVATDSQNDAQLLRKHLKGSVKVCLTEGKIDAAQVSDYLSVHGDLPKLKSWKPGDSLPILTTENNFNK